MDHHDAKYFRFSPTPEEFQREKHRIRLMTQSPKLVNILKHLLNNPGLAADPFYQNQIKCEISGL